MPRFVGSGVMNDEGRINVRDSVDSIGQRVIPLGDCLCGGSIELVEQILLLGLDEL
jgi:hypothetical protein